MRLPFLFGLGCNETVNKRLDVDCLRSRRVDCTQHEIHPIRCEIGPLEGVTRLMSPSLQVVGCGGGHLNFDAFDFPLLLLPLAIPTNAFLGCPVGHSGLLLPIEYIS